MPLVAECADENSPFQNVCNDNTSNTAIHSSIHNTTNNNCMGGLGINDSAFSDESGETLFLKPTSTGFHGRQQYCSNSGTLRSITTHSSPAGKLNRSPLGQATQYSQTPRKQPPKYTGKFVKPSPAAFRSTGILLKKTRNSLPGAISTTSNSNTVNTSTSSAAASKPIPETPLKRPLFSVGLTSPVGSETPIRSQSLNNSAMHQSRAMDTTVHSNLSFGSFDQQPQQQLTTPIIQRTLQQPQQQQQQPPVPQSVTYSPSPLLSNQAAPNQMQTNMKFYHFPEGIRSSSSLLELFQCSSPDRPPSRPLQTLLSSDISMGTPSDDMDAFDDVIVNNRQSGGAAVLKPLVWDLPFVNFLGPEYFKAIAQDPNYVSPSSSNHEESYFEGNFILLQQIGRGSFADAFKVQSISDEKIYAVKRTRSAFSGHKDRLEKLKEVELMWKIDSCPYCVPIKNAWEQNGHLFIQTDFYGRGTLADYLATRRLSEQETWSALADLTLGLKHLHSRQIVHLDIKPSNIFVADDGQLKIGDYGMAIELPVVDGLDREGDRVYMAPEVLRGVYGKPADLFSLGLVMLEIAAYCDLPESGEAWHNLRRADLSDVPFDECVTGELIEIIRGLLQPDPNLRLTVDHILLHPRVAETVYRRLYPISNRRN